MEEKILTGGGVTNGGSTRNQTVRIGDIVHKTAAAQHPMVREYLLYLEENGMAGVPRFLGVDAQGRDMFSYLPGKTMGPDYPHDHPCLHSDQCIIDTARFMRKLHDVSVGFLPSAIEAGWTNPFFPNEVPEIICHGDAAIWNFVYVNDRVAGLFDFEQAYPGTRCWELASTVPMMSFPLPYDYDAALHAGEAKRRIKLFFDEYCMPCPVNFMEVVVNRMLGMPDDICDDIVKRVVAGGEEAMAVMMGENYGHYIRWAAHVKLHGSEWM